MSLIEELNKVVNTDRWLAQSGLVTESMQENLYSYAWIANPGVADVEVVVDVQNNNIIYNLQLTKKAYKQWRRYLWWKKRTSNPTTIFKKWLCLRVLKKRAILDIEWILKRLVSEYLGSTYTITTNVTIWNMENNRLKI